MTSRERFARALDSQFMHLGVDAVYHDASSTPRTIRVIARRPEQLFELGNESLHGENPQLEFRVSDISQSRRGDEIQFRSQRYRIESEPRLDLHQLVWITRCLPVNY